MRIAVCSQAEALRLAEEVTEKTAIISITSKGDENVAFPKNPNILAVLHLKFNDLIVEYDEEGIPYGRELPQQEDLVGLKEFVTGLSCEQLIVHCWEGVSRSAAVAKAVYEFLGNKGILSSPQGLSPNPLVYKLVCRELNG
ncbi:MAG: hypothetical protein IJH70_14140 [Oscillospiraceae bacterium]|nr:hypothetical protein [Oscillospiraceae bacterium]